MDSVEMSIVTLTHSVSQSNSYAIVLSEKYGARRVPIVIGGNEAQAIAIAIEEMPTGRPMTHDLFKLIFDEINIELTSVLIYKLEDGVFYSVLQCKQGDDIYQIDSRTSDAIALAVRFNSSIYMKEVILEEAGIIVNDEVIEVDEDDLVELSSQTRQLDDLPVSRLQIMMQEMLDRENYEEAARIRDAINRKKLS